MGFFIALPAKEIRRVLLPQKVVDVKALRGSCSEREIARQTGVSRTRVKSVLNGQWDENDAARPIGNRKEREAIARRTAAPTKYSSAYHRHFVRCPGCGGKVVMDPACVLCGANGHVITEGKEIPEPRDVPGGLLELHLIGGRTGLHQVRVSSLMAAALNR